MQVGIVCPPGVPECDPRSFRRSRNDQLRIAVRRSLVKQILLSGANGAMGKGVLQKPIAAYPQLEVAAGSYRTN